MIYSWLIFGTIVNAYVGLMSSLSVLLKSWSNKIAFKFGVFCLFMTCWALAYFFPLVPEDPNLSMLSFQLLMVPAIFIAVAHLDFIVHFLRIEQRYRPLVWAGYLFNLAIVLTVPTDLFITGVSYKFDFGYWANPGISYHIWLVAWLAYIAFSLYLLARHLTQATGIRRKQIKYLFFGDLMTFGMGSTNFFFFYDINILPYFNLFASGQMLLFSYVIARYRFSNIRLNFLQFLKKTLSFVLAFVSLYIIYFYINLFINIPVSLSTDLIFLIVALTLYHFFDALFNIKYLARLFRLSDHEAFHQTVTNFTKNYGFDSSLKKLEERLEQTFVTELELGHMDLVLLQNLKGKQKDSPLLKHLKSTQPGEILIYSEQLLQAQDQKVEPEFLDEMQAAGELFLPIHNAKSQLMAYLVLGSKAFGNPYNNEEIQVLRELSHYLSKSLEVINYHKDLADEVRVKTRALRRKNQQLEESFARLKELDNVKDEFLSIASHELRTPLTIIKGYTDFLRTQDYGPLNAKQQEFADKIQRNTDELISMINCMLDISRLESGRMQFEFEEVDLETFLKGVQKEFKMIYKEKGIGLSFSNPKKLTPKVNVDKEKLTMVMTNLLGNAYKFTPQDGAVKVSITPANRKKYIQVRVADNGIGVPEDKQEFIFNKFQQAENPLQKTYAGSGLGLNITRQIIEKMKGEIWVESEGKVKTGSVFIFTLPLK